MSEFFEINVRNWIEINHETFDEGKHSEEPADIYKKINDVYNVTHWGRMETSAQTCETDVGWVIMI